jgi:VIT1/CCC1 family predicted Fe2+/Mn2+ transporter
MRHSLQVGFSFGLTSGIITTLGLMVGLNSSTHSKLVVIGGILIIAIADALSDAMGIHISEESEKNHSSKEVWESTITTFLCKFVFSSIFIIPVVLLELSNAVIFSIGLGLGLLVIFSFNLAKQCNKKAWKVVTEHLIIATLVIIATHYVGYYISIIFG